MASITIPRLDEDVKKRICMRAAVTGRRAGPRNLAKFTRECFASLGGFDLELPARGPTREPPDYS